MYRHGEEVFVEMPSGWKKCFISEVIVNYGWSGEVKYLIRSNDFETIASARSIRKTNDTNRSKNQNG